VFKYRLEAEARFHARVSSMMEGRVPAFPFMLRRG
jgi:hypothetical protein